jgi:hypothetical protein
MSDDLKANALVNDALSSALRSGGNALDNIPALLKRVLLAESWRHFVTRRGDEVTHERFESFVVTPPLKGLGGTVDLIKRVVEDDKATLDLLDQALEGRQGERSDLVNNINEVRPQGTSQSQALRRLRKDEPELHAEVLAGNLTAHAAMVKAGYRPRTGTVRYDDPESTARSLRRHMPPDTRRALARLLLDD